jgi:hypothetical protein
VWDGEDHAAPQLVVKQSISARIVDYIQRINQQIDAFCHDNTPINSQIPWDYQNLFV